MSTTVSKLDIKAEKGHSAFEILFLKKSGSLRSSNTTFYFRKSMAHLLSKDAQAATM